MDATFWQLILDLLILLGSAGVLGVLCERLKQSAVVGYMLAGVLVGPNGFGFIQNEAIVNTISQLGVALLMFSIGLEFSWSKLKRLGATALISGTAQILGTMAITTPVGMALGLSFKTSIAIGSLAALSSTAVVAPALAKRAELDSPHGRFCLGILLVQDAAVVPLVLLVTALAGQGTVGQMMIGAGQSVLIVGGFVLVAYLAARFVLPQMLKSLTGNRDIVVLLAFAAAAGASLAAYKLNISPALGAFIVAIFLGESPLATQVRADVAPLRTLFVTLFFGAIGMLADPAYVAAHPHWVLLAVGLVMVGKPLVMLPIGLIFRMPLRHAVAAGLSLGQVGVFSFVLLQVGQSGGDPPLIGSDLAALMVATIILTIFLTPYLVGAASPVGAWTELRLRHWGLVRSKAGEALADPTRGDQEHVVIIGFGPAGRAVAAALRQGEVPIAIADLNLRTVRAARAEGIRAIVGDATQPETLDQLDLSGAIALVITVPDHRLAEQVIQQARVVHPSLPIIVRSRYSAYVDDLTRAGAHVVIDEETTLGERVGEVLRDLLGQPEPGPSADDEPKD